MTVELRHLRCFLAIAEEGTFTRAAVRLHLTQPALSRTLRQLENHLSVRLIDRSTHHLELTGPGRVFRDRIAHALAAIDEALDPARLGTWPLRVGHSWSALGPHTTALQRRWQQAHPDVPLELLRIDDRSAGLAQGRADVVLVRQRLDLPDVRTEQLLTESRFAVVPVDSPLAARPSLVLADLADQPLAVNPVSGSTTLDLWPAGSAPTSTVTVANTDDWLAAIAAGRAVGVSTSATAAMYVTSTVAYVPLTDAPDVTVFVVWREPPSHPAVADFVALAHEVVSG
jgi:DNA-binding transcriptional LysR family regulator